jgi:RNA polymerase-binding transcription factor DksA
MTPQERAALQALVVSERGAMAATEADLASQHQAVVEASAHANLDDEHDPEGATVGFERARVASLLSHARSRLAELDDAAERLHDGTYGTCERCGQPIAFERLSAYPSAVLCMRCAHASAPSPLDDGGGHATSRRR